MQGDQEPSVNGSMSAEAGQRKVFPEHAVEVVTRAGLEE